MKLLPPPPPYSMYARIVIDRGPEAVGRELDRLQNKILRAQCHMREIRDRHYYVEGRPTVLTVLADLES